MTAAKFDKRTTPKPTHGLAVWMAEQRDRIKHKLGSLDKRIARRRYEDFSGPVSAKDEASSAWDADRALNGFRGIPGGDIERRTALSPAREVIHHGTLGPAKHIQAAKAARAGTQNVGQCKRVRAHVLHQE